MKSFLSIHKIRINEWQTHYLEKHLDKNVLPNPFWNLQVITTILILFIRFFFGFDFQFLFSSSELWTQKWSQDQPFKLPEIFWRSQSLIEFCLERVLTKTHMSTQMHTKQMWNVCESKTVQVHVVFDKSIWTNKSRSKRLKPRLDFGVAPTAKFVWNTFSSFFTLVSIQL